MTRNSSKGGISWASVRFKKSVLSICKIQERHGWASRRARSHAGLWGAELHTCCVVLDAEQRLRRGSLCCPTKKDTSGEKFAATCPVGCRICGQLREAWPATGQWAGWPQSEKKVKERWALCLFDLSVKVQPWPGACCIFSLHKASCLSSRRPQKPWLSCWASVCGFPIIHLPEARHVQKSE